MDSVNFDWSPQSSILAAVNAADSGPSTFLLADRPQAPADSPQFPEIPGFVIHEKVGRGGMGEVYKATQTSLNRIVALKLLPEHLSRKKQFVDLFYEETQALSTLTHPNIVTIIDRGNVGSTYYFVMEYVVGTPLLKKIGRPMAARHLVKIAVSICQGLQYAHGEHLVHRDIKPANIMLTANGVTKLMDFGLAGVISGAGRDRPTGSGCFMGTPGYMSPEQQLNADYADERSDIYSLGVVLYEMATGRRPNADGPAPVSAACERADPRLDPIIAKCLHDDPQRRYQTAEALLDDLGTLCRELDDEPSCPACGAINPVRTDKCENCGRSLQDHFDLCTDCGAQNRCDVRRCLKCGADLKVRRAEIQAQIDQNIQKALQLAYVEDFHEVRRVLKKILEVKGRAFQEARMRVAAALKKLDISPRRLTKERFRQGRLLFDKGHMEDALAVWQSLAPQSEEIKTIVRSVAMNMERTRVLHRARRTILMLTACMGLALTLAVTLGAMLLLG